VYVKAVETNVPSVLPNTASGEMVAVVTVITLAVAAAIVVTTVARQLAKKHYNA
jgi:hypothetical protein